MTDQGGPGTCTLVPAFTIPVKTLTVSLSFDHVATNRAADTIVAPAGLDHTGPANQHARADLLFAGAHPFSTNPADIVLNMDLGADPGQPANRVT